MAHTKLLEISCIGSNFMDCSENCCAYRKLNWSVGVVHHFLESPDNMDKETLRVKL